MLLQRIRPEVALHLNHCTTCSQASVHRRFRPLACSSTVLLHRNWNTTAASVTCLVAVTLYSVPSSVSSVGVLLLKTGPSAASPGTACSSCRYVFELDVS